MWRVSIRKIFPALYNESQARYGGNELKMDQSFWSYRKTGSTTHGRLFSRRIKYNSAFLSGWCYIILPISAVRYSWIYILQRYLNNRMAREFSTISRKYISPVPVQYEMIFCMYFMTSAKQANIVCLKNVWFHLPWKRASISNIGEILGNITDYGARVFDIFDISLQFRFRLKRKNSKRRGKTRRERGWKKWKYSRRLDVSVHVDVSVYQRRISVSLFNGST